MARLVQADGHDQVDPERMRLLERQIGELILQLGLEGTSKEVMIVRGSHSDGVVGWGLRARRRR